MLLDSLIDRKSGSRAFQLRTVAHQVTSVYAKLGVASHRELVALFA